VVFPVFLKLGGRRVLLVGGGRVAAGKLSGLLDAGAEVTVVAPTVAPEIAQAPVTVIRRSFQATDLDGVCYVVAAAPADVNAEVAREADGRGLFVNAVDDVAHASAYLGAVLRRAGVTIAVSTDGAAPALAGLLREGLEALLPDDLEGWMTCARETRQRWLADRVPMEQRRPLLLEALVALYPREAAAGPEGRVQGR
jgi:uroporphyrin-III C-methyltransferase/precorrin-2 dehydrogenase/sirohydrochlorin ferrochelatase